MKLTNEEKEYILQTFGKETFDKLFEEYYEDDVYNPDSMSDDEFGDLFSNENGDVEDVDDEFGTKDKKLSKDEALEVLYGVGEKLPGRKQQEFFDALEEITDMGEDDESEFYGEEDLTDEI